MLYSKLDAIKMEYIDICKWIHPDVYISYSTIPNAGLGVFAKRDIKPGTFLGEYLGEIKDRDDTTKDDYSFNYNKHHVISALDINKSNYTRFMNCAYDYDSENVYCINMITDYIYANTKNLRDRKFFYAQKLIKTDTELLYYYGDEYANGLGIQYRIGDNMPKNFGE